MKPREINQNLFSSILFDTLFGLVIFFGIEALAVIKEPLHFIFYFFATLVVIHWWLLFKSADDFLGNEVNDSLLDVAFGLVYLVFLQFIVVFAREYSPVNATWFLWGVLMLDLAWLLIWRYVGQWEKSLGRERIAFIEHRLSQTIKLDLVFAGLTLGLLLIGHDISRSAFAIACMGLYSIYLLLTFVKRICDINWY